MKDTCVIAYGIPVFSVDHGEDYRKITYGRFCEWWGGVDDLIHYRQGSEYHHVLPPEHRAFEASFPRWTRVYNYPLDS